MIITNSTDTTMSLADLNHLVNSLFIYFFCCWDKILIQKLLNAHHAEFQQPPSFTKLKQTIVYIFVAFQRLIVTRGSTLYSYAINARLKRFAQNEIFRVLTDQSHSNESIISASLSNKSSVSSGISSSFGLPIIFITKNILTEATGLKVQVLNPFQYDKRHCIKLLIQER